MTEKEKEFHEFYMTVRKRNHLRKELKQTLYETEIKIYQEREGKDKLVISETGEDADAVFESALFQLHYMNERRKA